MFKLVKDKYTAYAHSLNEYSLTIHKFNLVTDYGKWGCRDGPRGTYSPCTKRIGKAFCLFLNIEQMLSS